MDIQKVLSEWFGSISDWDDYEPDKAQRWWSAAPAFDAYLERHYRELVERALSGQLERWRETPSGTLGGVLLLDQFTRNIFRGTKEMYLGDARARQWTREALNQSVDEELPLIQRQFLYMPLMHSEQLEDQNESVARFEQLVRAASPLPAEHPLGHALEQARSYAKSHRDIVERFGRFPHRNSILGRASTPEEIEFLKQPGSSF